VALSDGAGSVSGSEEAASITTDVIVHRLTEEFDILYEMSTQQISKILLDEIRIRVNKETDVKAACTVLFFARAKDGRAIYGHLGDGMIFADGESGDRVLSYPENGDEPNQTFFVSHRNAEQRFRVTKGNDFSYNVVLLCSDGLSELLYNNEHHRIAKAVSIMSRWIQSYTEQETKELIDRELEEMFSRYSNDDMSIAMMSFGSEV